MSKGAHMADLSTTYMGIPVKTPIIVAASTISSMVNRIELAEQVGAGALIIRSLFEEQILFDQQQLNNFIAVEGRVATSPSPPFARTTPRGAEEHLEWIERARETVKMPLIASLNAVSPGSWVHYARQLEQTGVDGLELNIFSVAADPNQTAAEIEKNLYDIVESVMAEVKIPVAVKLSPTYTAMANVAVELDRRGVAALVLFNRFLQPTIDVETESLFNELTYSSPEEMKVPLRWTALLYGKVKADLALTTGVHTGQDAIRAILAGAAAVQVAATLYKNGIPYITTMLQEMEQWMVGKGYQSLADFKAKVSQQNTPNPVAFERAQYLKLIFSQR
jgi:dihydroorotate dehydrogenase (fumarate)